MTTTTEKYIKKAVNEAKKELSGNRFEHINIDMNLEASGATKALAKALMLQAEANKANSKAIESLSEKLKLSEACAIKIVNKDVEFL